MPNGDQLSPPPSFDRLSFDAPGFNDLPSLGASPLISPPPPIQISQGFEPTLARVATPGLVPIDPLLPGEEEGGGFEFAPVPVTPEAEQRLAAPPLIAAQPGQLPVVPLAPTVTPGLAPPPTVTPVTAPGIAAPPSIGVAPAVVRDPLAVDQEIGATLTEINRLGQQRTVLRRDAEDLQTQIALEPDEVKRAALIARQGEIATALDLTERDLRRKQEDAQIAQTEQDDQLRVEADTARLDARDKAREALSQQQAATAIDEERFNRQREVAQRELNTAKQERIEIIRRGAPELKARTVLEMAAEELRATNEGRPPNFGKVFDRLITDAQDVLRRETTASTEEVTFGVDEFSDLVAQQDRKRLLDAATNEAALEEILADTEQRIARATNAADRQRLAGRAQQIRNARDAAVAESLVVADERARKAAKENAGIEKLQAEARLKRAQAAKEERRGRGGRGRGKGRNAALLAIRPELREIAKQKGGVKIARDIEQRAVFDPFSGELLTRSDGTPGLTTNTAQAQDLAEKGEAAVEINALIEEIVSLRGGFGFEFTNEFIGSDEGAVMVSKAELLKAKLNSAFGLGALDSGTQIALELMIGGDPSGFADPTAALRNIQKATETGYNNALRTTGTGAKVRFAITTKAPEVKLADVEVRIDSDLDPKSGKFALSQDDFEAKVEEEEVLLRREIGRAQAAGPSRTARDFEPTVRRTTPREAPKRDKDESPIARFAREVGVRARAQAALTERGEVPTFAATSGVEGVRARRNAIEQSTERNEARIIEFVRRDEQLGRQVSEAERDGNKGLARQLVDTRKKNIRRINFLKKKVSQGLDQLKEFDTQKIRARKEAADVAATIELPDTF